MYLLPGRLPGGLPARRRDRAIPDRSVCASVARIPGRKLKVRWPWSVSNRPLPRPEGAC